MAEAFGCAGEIPEVEAVGGARGISDGGEGDATEGDGRDFVHEVVEDEFVAVSVVLDGVEDAFEVVAEQAVLAWMRRLILLRTMSVFLESSCWVQDNWRRTEWRVRGKFFRVVGVIKYISKLYNLESEALIMKTMSLMSWMALAPTKSTASL